MSGIKTAFLILRIEQLFKERIVKKAKEKAQTVSEYIRSILEKEI